MPTKGQSKLSDAQWAEVACRYQAGESAPKIAGYYGVHSTTIYEHLAVFGIARRGGELEIDRITDARWWELYASPTSGYPSVRALADRFGVTSKAVSYRLKRARVVVRSRGEQQRIDHELGRRSIPEELVMPGHCFHRPDGQPEWLRRCKVPKESRRRAGKKLRRQVTVACNWCGIPLTRKPSDVPPKFPGCSLSHSALTQRFYRKNGPDAPRPLIADRLEALAREELYALRVENRDYTRQANTYEQLEKLAERLGAREPEILEVIDRQVREGRHAPMTATDNRRWKAA